MYEVCAIFAFVHLPDFEARCVGCYVKNQVEFVLLFLFRFFFFVQNFFTIPF